MFDFGDAVFRLRFGKFPTEERYWPVSLSYHCSQLRCGGVSVYLKRLGKVWVGQDYLFGDGNLYVVKRSLVD
jgi:hypothetical protein